MAAKFRHLALNADDVQRAKAFYETVFGWTFEDWGPPGFYLINGAGMAGALQARHDKLTGAGLRAFECTVGVDSLDEIEPKVAPAGGRVVMKRSRIQTVGELIYIEDTEGNRVGIMKYDEDHSARMDAQAKA
jgi:predicted enzyme related to lactoylglutathione lyase